MSFTTLPQIMQSVLSSQHASKLSWYELARGTEKEAEVDTHGTWCHISGEEFQEQVAAMCLALVKLGFKRGEKCCIMAEPSPYWLMMDLAIMSAGGVSVPIFAHINHDIFTYQIEDADIHWCFLDGDEAWSHVEKHMPRWVSVISHHYRGDADNMYTIDGLLEMGRQEIKEKPQQYEKLRDAVEEDDLATIIYTSGSTGNPKGVCLSQKNIVMQVHAAADLYPLHSVTDNAADCAADSVTDHALSCLPLAHIFERMVMYMYLSRGIPITFADDIQNVGNLLREIKPTCITMVPRLLEKIHIKIQASIAAGSWVKRKLGRWALAQAQCYSVDEAASHWSFRLARKLVLRKIHASMGEQLRYVIVGGARLNPELCRLFVNIGLPVYEGYGLTESAPVLACNYRDNRRIGSVGKIFPGVELRIGSGDEILARGANIMMSYHNAPEETAQVIDADGWLHTGDRGKLEDGFLAITGRIKNLMKTSNGKYVAPVPIEQRMCASPMIDMAMVIAEGRTCVSVLLFLDLEYMQQMQRDQRQEAVKYSQYIASVVVQTLIQEHIDEVNTVLNKWEQLRIFHCVHELPSVDNEELTPTMKIRRYVIEEHYADVIEAMYDRAHEGESI